MGHAVVLSMLLRGSGVEHASPALFSQQRRCRLDAKQFKGLGSRFGFRV